MTAVWILTAAVFPVVLALGVCVGPLRRAAMKMAWTAPLPALVVAIAPRAAGPPGQIEWLMLGVEAGGPDELSRALLLPVALLWLAAGVFAETYLTRSSHQASFWLAFLVTCGGNLGALLARDVGTFYVAYAVMTFAAYGLVLHERTDEARRAGRVYIAMAFAGEMALLAALWMIVGERVNLPISEAPLAAARVAHPDLLLGLLFVGFGVKAGVLPLHVWLPLAHPVAPTPASAILSGALIKAGLFGWLRFLPLGLAAFPSFGAFVIVLAVVTIAYAALVGALQREPKTVLAYSSISQMGFMLLPVGVGLAVPSAAAVAVAAALLFAQQHALVKGALFLGTAVLSESAQESTRRLVIGGLVVSALAIAGGPFTSGALAKLALKDVVSVVPAAAILGAALSIGSIGSTLLMARFLSSVVTGPRSDQASAGPRRGLWAPWMFLTGAAIAHPVFASSRGLSAARLFDGDVVWSASWPLAAGAGVVGAALVAARRGVALPAVPPGDVVVPIERCARRVRAALSFERTRSASRWAAGHRVVVARVAARELRALELRDARMAGFATIGGSILLLLLASAVTTHCSAGREHDGSPGAPAR